LELAGAEQCQVTRTMVGKLEKPKQYHFPSLEIAYGPAGGMVVFTTYDGHAFTLPLDGAGAAKGEPRPFDGLGDLWVSDLVGFDDGFVALVDDKETLNGDNHSAYWVEADGTVRHPALAIPFEPLATLSRAGPTANRFLLTALERDIYDPSAPVHFEMALVTRGGDGRLQRELWRHRIELPSGGFVSSTTALSKDHWVATVQTGSHSGEEPGSLAVFYDGKLLDLEPGLTNRAVTYLTEKGRSGWMQLVENDLVMLEAAESDRDKVYGVMVAPSGESSDTGLTRTLNAHIVTLQPDGSHERGPARTIALDQPLPKPFTQELFLDVGTKMVTRRTRYGLLRVGQTTALEPPMRDGSKIKSAWSGSHFVLAELANAGGHYFIDLRSLDCRKREPAP
jgi:hypothetical protein